MKILSILVTLIFITQCSKKQKDEAHVLASHTWVLETLKGYSGSLEGNRGKPVLKLELAD